MTSPSISQRAVAPPFRLTGRLMFLYALPTLAHAVATTPMVTFVPGLYAQELGLPLALVGSMLFLSRFADVFIDPVIGWLSDRTRTPWGRRKPFILLGLPLMALACWNLFVPPPHAGLGYLFGWLFALYAAFSLIDIPYQSWGAELSTDYAGRSRIGGLKQAFDQGSSLMALALTSWLTLTRHAALPEIMRVLAITACVGLPLLFGINLLLVPEPPPPPDARASLRDRYDALGAVFRNRGFVALVAAASVFVIGGAIAASLHMLVITHVFKAPRIFALVILLESAASIIGIPFWVKLSDRIGKHRAAAIAAAWTILLALPWPLLGPAQLPVFIALVGVRGLANGGLLVMIFSMAADTVDVERARSGAAPTGLYFSVLSFTGKMAVAVGVLAGTALPGLIGFQPSRANTSTALFGLVAVYAWLPAVIKLCALPLFWRYPLTAARHAELKSEIAARDEAAAVQVSAP